MIHTMRVLLVTSIAFAALALAACGASGTSFLSSSEDSVSKESAFGGVPPAPAPAAAAPAAAVERAAAESKAVFEAPPLPAAATHDEALQFEESGLGEADSSSAVLLSQQRIIIYTVDLSLVVSDVSATLDSVVVMAEEMGGWFVGKNDTQKHRGSISIRVPAESREAAVLRLRQMAIEVESEVSRSQDVTDEYYDARARLASLEAERDALRTLFDNATDVEDALRVREALVRVQGDVEVLQGQINRLERTSAFSLITVNLGLEPAEMPVDAGPDQTTGVGEAVRFRATFKPPEDIDQFVFTWDFGDGTRTVTSDRTTQTEDPDTQVTATVTHQYHDERDSPYFAEVKITGTGKAGLAEAEDTFVVTVTRVPTIEVFAGESVTVDEGEELEFSGSFTRPEGVSGVEFTWDFGDGTPPAKGSLEDGVTVAVAMHVYENFRPFPYRATLTITAASDAGEARGTSSANVRVREGEGWVVAGWSLTDQGKTAVRALSAVGQGVVSVVVWGAILSPAWGAIVVVGFLAWRFRPWRPKRAGGRRKGDAGSG